MKCESCKCDCTDNYFIVCDYITIIKNGVRNYKPQKNNVFCLNCERDPFELYILDEDVLDRKCK